MKIPPALALALFVLATGWGSPLFRLADAPPFLASGCRVGIATLLLLPFAGRAALRTLVADPSVAWRSLAAGALLAAHFGAWVPSLDYTSVAASTLLVSTSPLFAAAIEVLVLRAALSRRLVAGVAIAFAGTALVLVAEADSGAARIDGRALLGDGLALLGALFGASYFAVGRSLRDRVPLGAYLVLVNGAAALLLLATSLAAGEPWRAVPGSDGRGLGPETLLWFALLALVPHLLGHGSANLALRSYPATVVNSAVLGEPLVASLLALALFGERPSAMLIVAAPVVLAGLALVLTARPADAVVTRPAIRP